MPQQQRFRIFGFEPDTGGGQLLERVLRAVPGVLEARFDERYHAVCVEFIEPSVMRAALAAIERTGFRATVNRRPCSCCA